MKFTDPVKYVKWLKSLMRNGNYQALLITGMSGAGKSITVRLLKDAGIRAVDIDHFGEKLQLKGGSTYWLVDWHKVKLAKPEVIVGVCSNMDGFYTVLKSSMKTTVAVIIQFIPHHIFIDVMKARVPESREFKSNFLELSKLSKSRYQRDLRRRREEWSDNIPGAYVRLVEVNFSLPIAPRADDIELPTLKAQDKTIPQ